MFDKNQLEKMTKATAYDKDGDKVGSVGQIYADNESGQPTFATVKTGLFGTSESFVPLEGARVDGDDLRLAFDKATIKDAPRIDEDGQLDPREEDRLYQHYGLAGGHTATAGEHHDHDHGKAAAGTAAAGTAAGVAGAAHGKEHHDAEHGHRDRERREGESVTAYEERLAVGTETREAGTARLRKYTTTEKETIEVPVQKEKLVVEREDVSGKVRKGGLDEHGTGDIEEEITLREERPVVEKETVERERVRVGKEQVTDTERVSGEVRKEHIDVDTDGKGTHGKGDVRH